MVDYLRTVVTVILLLVYTGVFLTSILATALPVAKFYSFKVADNITTGTTSASAMCFNFGSGSDSFSAGFPGAGGGFGSGSSGSSGGFVTCTPTPATVTNTYPKMTLWENCTRTDSGDCSDLVFHCSRSKYRFNTARAFTILTILFSTVNIISCVISLGQLVCFSNMEASVRALRACTGVGLFTLIFSIIALAMVVVVNSSPLCEGFTRLMDIEGWKIADGPISAAVCACFALVGSTVGKVMQGKISTSKLGI